MLNLYDTNNWARVRFEKDSLGLPLRGCFVEAFTGPTSVYFFDGYNGKELRKAKYPGYKLGRTPAPDNFYHMLGFFKELLMHTGNVIVEVPGYEADDVIATYVLSNPDLDMSIHSTDKDFCALIRPGVLTPMANSKGIAPHEVRLNKTLCGDNSDKITGIVGFGPKSWNDLDITHKVNWVQWLNRKAEFSMTQLGLTQAKHINWVSQNSELLRTFWEIIGFYDVPLDLIAKHTKVGTKDYLTADKKLKDTIQ